uniref:Uncharacterized protein n=1 Tax=Arundo donax TaxID=35708 RepID=A0A0A9H829_ARUDO
MDALVMPCQQNMCLMPCQLNHVHRYHVSQNMWA